MSQAKYTEHMLQTPIQYLKGVGPKRAEALNQLGIRTVNDLLYYFPRSYIDLSRVEKIGKLHRVVDTGDYVTVIGKVRRVDLLGRPPKQRLVIVLGDETGTVALTFFRGVQFYRKAFEV
ncbi:MAG: ATP-dependent DNA helicase RecG, partial [Ignavibacteriae bacterium]|nr:ATP-dependent DNA helicase RecG [Ignavibacteriota bacterium]